jgi:hypothetical protein
MRHVFSYYMNIFNKYHDFIRSFYVKSKLRHPITVMRDTCAEGETGPNSWPADFEYDTELSTNYAPLHDGSILFVVIDGGQIPTA